MKLTKIIARTCLLAIASGGVFAEERMPASNGPDGISADSKRIFFQSWIEVEKGRYGSQHFSMDTNGGDIRRDGRLGRSIGWPSFTSDGLKAVLHTRIGQDAELVVLDLAEPNNLNEFSSMKRLTFDDKADFFPTWSPDGNQIAFYGLRTGVGQIFTINADGTNLKNLSNTDVRESDPTWSVQGEITFESHVSGNADVWVMNGDGSGRRNLTNHPSEDSWGAWSPDGEQIVFSSDRDGDHDLYIMDRDGSNVRQITNTLGVDHWPRWAPDGSFIVFSREIEDLSAVVIIKPDGSGEKELTHRYSYHTPR